MSDFYVPGSRPNKNTMKFRKSTVSGFAWICTHQKCVCLCGFANTRNQHLRSSVHSPCTHQKSTPQKSSWIVSGIFEWTSSGIFPWHFTCKLHLSKDCHFPSGFVLNMFNGLSVDFPLELHFCELWCVIFCPERFPAPKAAGHCVYMYVIVIISSNIITYQH